MAPAPVPSMVLAAACLALLAAPAGGTHEPRVETARYVLGPGDAGCFQVAGPGCVRFLAQAGESEVTIAIDDDVHDPVAADLCDDAGCGAAHLCGSGALGGLTTGEQVVVLINLATGGDTCPVADLGAGFAGTVTATFT